MANKKLTDNDLMPFGKYKGTPMIEVPAKYLLYMLNELNISPGNVRDYIVENKEVLEKEVREQKQGVIRDTKPTESVKLPPQQINTQVDDFGDVSARATAKPSKTDDFYGVNDCPF